MRNEHTEIGDFVTGAYTGSATSDGVVLHREGLVAERRMEVKKHIRLDGARTSDGHHGIGLSLVRALCAALGLTATVEQRPEGTVAFCIRTAAQVITLTLTLTLTLT